MPLENASKISELVATNPVITDPVGQGDDHLRMLKRVLLAEAQKLDNVATMKNTDLPIGAVVDTLGYSVAGVGAGRYIIAATQVVDGFGDHELSNGNVALLVSKSGDISLYGGGYSAVDNKLVFDAMSARGLRVFRFDTDVAGALTFSAPPVLDPDVSFICSDVVSVVGATSKDVQLVRLSGAAWKGFAGLPEINDSKVRVVAGTIRQQKYQLCDITAVGTVATVTLVGHGYSANDVVEVVLADQAAYNGVFTISNVTTDTFDYTMDSSPASPATGVPQVRKPRQWDYIFDSGHIPIGVDSSLSPILVEEGGSGAITIPFADTFSRVLGLVCGPDETLANELGISVGASVGFDSFTLECSIEKTIAELVWWDGVVWQTASSFGQTGITGIEFSGSTLKLSHSYCPKVAVSLTPYNRDGARTPYQPVLREVQTDFTRLSFLDTTTRTYVSGEDQDMALMFKKTFRGVTRFDEPDVVYATGNIWFVGFMEV